MAHNPDSDMSIDSDVNAGYPFNELGVLMRQATDEHWTADKTLDKIQALIARYSPQQAVKPLDKTPDSLPPRKMIVNTTPTLIVRQAPSGKLSRVLHVEHGIDGQMTTAPGRPSFNYEPDKEFDPYYME